MKKLLIVVLTLLILFCSCAKKAELGGIVRENGLLYLDLDNPLIDAEVIEKKVTLSNGKSDTSYMKVPLLNVDLKGANAVSACMAEDLDSAYGDYFNKPDDRIVKIDYTYHEINDVLAVLITVTEITPETESTLTYVYYYDILVDTEMDIVSYSNTCGAQFSSVYKAVMNTEWAADYEKETGSLPGDDAVSALIYKGDNVFDVYCINTDGLSETIITVEPEKTEIDFSQFTMQE